MNEEQRVHRLLDDAVPTAPAPTGWADRAAKRTTRRRIGAGAAAVAVLAVAGVFVADAIPRGQRTEVAPASARPSVRPTATETVTMQVDLPYYATVESLAERADAIVSVRVVDSRSGLDGPDLSSHDPRVNPYVGASKTPSAAENEAMGVPITVYVVEITKAVAGPLAEHSTVEVVETGGLVGGVQYRVANLVPMSTAMPDLLFLEEVGGGRYASVGMWQGRFDKAEDGGYFSRSEPPLRIDGASDLERLARIVEE